MTGEEIIIPETRNGRIKSIRKLKPGDKVHFLPKMFSQFEIGPFIFEVTHLDLKKVRFTASLWDIYTEKGEPGPDRPEESDLPRIITQDKTIVGPDGEAL